jgi:hypothetical protein
VAEASDYFLTEEQLRDRFERRVRDFVFSGYVPQDEPVLVLLGAQPAAGKSQAMAAVNQRHTQGQLVPLTGDDLRPFHPQHQEILDNEPWLFPDATGQASGAWVRMSIEYAREHRYGLILEGVFRDPAMTLATAQEFASHGYPVEVVGLGVHQERSRLDSLHRFLEGGRWTPPDLHDLAYRKMPETVAAAEASPAVRRITITDRTGADLYVNDRNADGAWTGEPAAVQALHASRDRPLPLDDVAAWLGLHQRVVIELAARGQVDATSIPVLHQVALDAEIVAAMTPDSAAVQAHAAVRPLLQTLASGPLPEPLPPSLVTDEGLEFRTRASYSEGSAIAAERERRQQLPEPARQAEDALRRRLAERIRARRTLAPERRLSSTAARAKSTTVQRADKGRADPGAGPRPGPPRHEVDRPDERRGRSR